MAELSNIIAAELVIKVQRMASYPPFGFEFYQKDNTVEDPTAVKVVDLSTIQDVRMDIKNAIGVKVKRLSIGEGFEIVNNPDTGNPTILKMDKAYSVGNLPAGSYRYDMLVVISDTEAQIPVKGPFIVEPNITE